MSTARPSQHLPDGLGWMLGFLLGSGAGFIAWVSSGNPVLGVIILAATGTPLGYSIEQGLQTRPLTERQQRFLFWFASAGVVVGAVLLGYLIFVG